MVDGSGCPPSFAKLNSRKTTVIKRSIPLTVD